MNRWSRMQKQIQRLLEQLPPGEWWRETEHGELIPTLDLYLYLCDQLGIDIATTVTHEADNLYRATATLTHLHRTIKTDQLARIEPGIDNETLSNALAALQSRAILRACRLYLGAHLKAMQPNARHELLRILHALYTGYSRQDRLEHASYILDKRITSFNELTNAELATLISALVADEPSS
jgi:hypothetical protein